MTEHPTDALVEEVWTHAYGEAEVRKAIQRWYDENVVPLVRVAEAATRLETDQHDIARCNWQGRTSGRPCPTCDPLVAALVRMKRVPR